VLTLQGELWGEEEVLVGRCDYLIRSAGIHNQIVLCYQNIQQSICSDMG